MCSVNIINHNGKTWFKISNKSNIKIFLRTSFFACSSNDNQCSYLERALDRLRSILMLNFAWRHTLRQHFDSFAMHLASIHHHSWYVRRFLLLDKFNQNDRMKFGRENNVESLSLPLLNSVSMLIESHERKRKNSVKRKIDNLISVKNWQDTLHHRIFHRSSN